MNLSIGAPVSDTLTGRTGQYYVPVCGTQGNIQWYLYVHGLSDRKTRSS